MKIHLIGIGGIGVSALAQYYLSKGHQVSGSDLIASEITDFLKEKGIRIMIGNFAKNIEKDFDLVVHSPAVKPDNPELSAAYKFQISNFKFQIKSYPEALGELTKEYYTIAVAGSHGKSTTTAMIALILTLAGLDPTVIVGTKLKEFGGSNFRGGKSKLLVIEACEYDSSFLYYSPKIIVVTNVDKEHLDYFKTFANVKKAFKNFIKKLPSDGFLVQDLSDKQEDAAKLRKILKVPGEHNVLNALAGLSVARILAVPDSITFKALSEFKGTWRRFEERQVQILNFKFQIISDYAHHPVFQPHQHQRTYYLFNDFVKTFKNADIDNIVITDIYDVAGRETKKINSEVSSKKLVEKINKKNVLYLPVNKLEDFAKENIGSGDVLIIMGAGDIYKLVDKF
ncbi:MAG: Mur ligase domain-containing protein [Candidatus Staskawiczbacteria bacterium]|nr:Mur ligase domain-containing protein [Candidatus Staskawiczbacteria bacterium]